MKIFIEENTFNIGNLSAVEYDGCITGGNYEFQVIESKDYLVALPSGKLSCPDTEIEKSLDKNVLLSLISVLDEPISWDWNKINEYISPKKMIKWVKRNGLPCSQDEYLFNKFKKVGVSINDISLEIAQLYLIYNVWVAFNLMDENKISKYLRILDSKFGNKEKINNFKKHMVPIVIVDILNSRFDRIKIRFAYDYSFCLSTYSMLDICFFQLANIIARGDITSKNIKKCPSCNDLFIGHGNKKYCKNCNRKTEWSRKNKHKS